MAQIPDRQIVPIELSQIQSDVELQHVADDGCTIQRAAAGGWRDTAQLGGVLQILG